LFAAHVRMLHIRDSRPVHGDARLAVGDHDEQYTYVVGDHENNTHTYTHSNTHIHRHTHVLSAARARMLHIGESRLVHGDARLTVGDHYERRSERGARGRIRW